MAVTLNVLDSTDVQPCVPPVQQPTCSRGVTAKSTDAAGDTDSSSSTSRDALLNTLADDIYSYTVKCAVQGVRGCRMFKAALAMLFTFALQMGLLVLLWQAVVTSSATAVSKGTPANDKLWRQLGQVQRQVCWLNQHAVINATAAGGALDCSGAWAQCSASTMPAMSYLEFKQCVKTLADMPRESVDQKADRDAVKQACAGFETLDSSQKAFGTGLLFPEFITPAHYDWTLIRNGFWNSMVGHHPYRPSRRNLSRTTSLNLSSSEGCIPAVPNTPAQEPTLVNVLACLALAVYVHQDTMQALWLGCVSAACCGMLPAFYVTDVCTGVNCGSMCWWRKVVMLAAPVLQQVAAIAVLLSSMGLTFITETQASVVSIILGNVALSFILDLDNRVGVMLHTQALRNSCNPAVRLKWANAFGRAKPSGPCCQVQTWCTRFWGHVYMALLGFLLLAEPLCLASAPAWTLYTQIAQSAQQTAVSIWTGYAGYTYKLLRIFGVVTTLQPDFGKEESETFRLDYEIDRRVQYLQGQDITRQTYSPWLAFRVLYPCTLAVFVLLLYGTTITVTAARRWNPVLLAVQVIIAGSAFFLPAGLAYWVIGWLGMFVLWPLLHRPPTHGCRGCASCGCPKYQVSCPGECCCAC